MNDGKSGGWQPWQQTFLERHRLAPSYLATAQKWFDPLTDALVAHHHGAARALLVAINGCQGSGKTTLTDYLACALAARHGLNAISLSLDDCYLGRLERARLAAEVHPLLATRGVPGTHDMSLLQHTLDALLSFAGPVSLPGFDKALDDRCASASCRRVETAPDLVLLEGWCLGARPGPVGEPVNELERREDPDGRWRRFVNEALARDFLPLYRRVDRWIMLRAPSFDCVYRWRLEQERKLAAVRGAGASGIMDERALARFIMHYQRLTEGCLQDLPGRVDHLLVLDEDRQVIRSRTGPTA